MNISKKTKLIRLWCLLLCAFILVGCPAVLNIKDDTQMKRVFTICKECVENKSAVFGRIQWIEKGEEKKIGSGVFISLQLIRLEDKTVTPMGAGIDEKGEFTWFLEKGTYMIYKINYNDPWSGNYTIVPKVAFVVPDNGKAYYIGILKAEVVTKKRHILGLGAISDMRIKFDIVDRGDQDMVVFQERFAKWLPEVHKSLMVYEPSLPQTLATADDFTRAILMILNAILILSVQ